jgi:D-alanine-D-alanine ligase
MKDVGNRIILFGGPSSERFVSCATAQHLVTVYPQASCCFWDEDDSVYSIDAAELLAHREVFVNKFVPGPDRVKKKWNGITAFLDECQREQGVLILGLHGGASEDGTLQSLCEQRNLFFTGSSSDACRTAMNKMAAKAKVRPRGVKLAAELAMCLADRNGVSDLQHFQRQFGEIVIKPRDEGSSVGLGFIKSSQELDQWLKQSQDPKRQWIVEEMIHGREFTVGVMMLNRCLMALPCSEVILERNARFDYEGKYLGKGNKEITPADIPPQLERQLQETVLIAHSAIGCYGYSRSEVILSDRGIYFLETNTLPGMTKASFLPQQLAAAQIPVKTFLDYQCELALMRYQLA